MAYCTPLAAALSDSMAYWDKFETAIGSVVNELLPLSPQLSWPVIGASGRHIGDVSPADFGFKLANISWTLVDARFGSVNGGVGWVKSYFTGDDWQDPKDWIRAEEQINRADFVAYLDLDGGMEYLILHETAHVTTLGLQTNNQQFDQYLAHGGDRNDGAAWARSPQWLYNEQVANAIARTVAGQLGLAFLDHPTCGFPDDPGVLPPIRESVVAV